MAPTSCAIRELVEAASQLPVPDLATVTLKKPEEFELIGKSLPRTDIPAKVDGSATFGLDVRVPGMVYAVVARCPVFGGKVKSFDATKAKAMKGVYDVFTIDPVPEGVHCGGWRSGGGGKHLYRDAGAQAVADRLGFRSAREREQRKFAEAIPQAGGFADEGGAEPGRRRCRHLGRASGKEDRVRLRASVPGARHDGADELHRAHSKRRSGGLGANASARLGQGVIAQVSGLPPQKIQVHTTFMGGGFGRRYQGDFAMEAAQVAKHVGKPVQLVWSREDDMTHDFYRPASYHRISGAVDANGNIIAWRHKSTSTSIADYWGESAAGIVRAWDGDQMPYLAKNYKLEYLPAASGVPRAWWRSVEASVIGFVMESFMDELAHAAGADPYEFRIQKLGETRLVKDRSDEKERPLDTGRFKDCSAACRGKERLGQAAAERARAGNCRATTRSTATSPTWWKSRSTKAAVRVNRVVSAVDIGTASESGWHSGRRWRARSFTDLRPRSKVRLRFRTGARCRITSTSSLRFR